MVVMMQNAFSKIIMWFFFFMAMLFSQGWGLSPTTNTAPEASRILVPDEFLQYKVSYMWIRVGTLKIYNFGIQELEGFKGYHLRIYIDSNPSVPFVKVHDMYEVLVNEKFEPIYFIAWEKQSDHILKTTYEHRYLPGDSVIRAREIQIYEDREVLKTDTIIPVDAVYRDALSLLFYARYYSSIKSERFDTPIIAYLRKERCYFDFSGVVHNISFKDTAVAAYYLRGKIKFLGIVGIKDDFEGWFSPDPQRVPLKAKLKAFFGSVGVELEDYKNWKNPLFSVDN